MRIFPLNPGTQFEFEVTGPIDPSTKWSFYEFYAPADRTGSPLEIFRKLLALALVNLAIKEGHINKAGVWRCTMTRKGLKFRIRVRHMTLIA